MDSSKLTPPQFGAVIAVSHAKSPRRERLLWAAQLAGVDMVVPGQPEWGEADVEGFRGGEGSVISRGSALAWMGHLNALRWYVPHIFVRVRDGIHTYISICMLLPHYTHTHTYTH